MNIIMKNINDITPYENNPRNNINAVQVVANSIREFGFKNPIVVDKDNVIINGHTRYLAAKSLELNEVPVLVADDLSEEQVKAFRIMDNKSSEFAEWDYEKLVAEIKDIEIADFDVELTGFDIFEIEALNSTYDKALEEINFDDEFIGVDEEEGENTTAEKENKNYSIQYNIVFNTEEEQDEWYSFLSFLKRKHADVETISERILIEVREIMKDE